MFSTELATELFAFSVFTLSFDVAALLSQVEIFITKKLPFLKMKTLVIFLFLTPFLVSGENADQTVNQVGLWNVTTCIKANFSMNFTFFLKNYEPQIPVTIYVPKDAEVDDLASKCGNGNEDQILALKWKDDAKNNTELDRSITISFKKNETLGL